jgi:hypothetical protein
VQVKKLPTTYLHNELLEAEFSEFGPLFKRGHGYAITIHNQSREQGGGKVAYVKFETAKGAEAACAGRVSILGRVVEVVKHEGGFPTPHHRGQARGGYRGRGGNYRGEATAHYYYAFYLPMNSRLVVRVPAGWGASYNCTYIRVWVVD